MNSNLQAFSQTLTAREMYTQVSNYSPVEVGDQQICHYTSRPTGVRKVKQANHKPRHLVKNLHLALRCLHVCPFTSQFQRNT